MTGNVIRWTAVTALLAVVACGGGASKSDIVTACKASVKATEEQMAARYGS